MDRPPDTFDWEHAKQLPWRQRNAAVEAALRYFLSRCEPRTVAPLSTMELAEKLGGDSKLAQLLTRLAPYLSPLARHDGETIMRYGRRWKRWQWYPTDGDEIVTGDRT